MQFPRTGYGAVKSQMTRSAESILFNIAEGCGASTPNEFARYLDMSIKSTGELEAQLELAKDYGIMGEDPCAKLTERAIDARRMLVGLRRKVLGDED